MVKYTIGERIKLIREKAAQSQETFARAMGVTPATINRYEKGHRTPDAIFLERIIIKYSCDPTWLLTGFDGSQETSELKSEDKNYYDPDTDEIVSWLSEVPEAKPLFVRLVKAYREFDAAVSAIRNLGIRNLKNMKP
jgi:transcriptional regulator with XRE-family HTH domain